MVEPRYGVWLWYGDDDGTDGAGRNKMPRPESGLGSDWEEGVQSDPNHLRIVNIPRVRVNAGGAAATARWRWLLMSCAS